MTSSCFWGHVKGNVLLLLPIHLQRTSISRKTCLSDNSWLTIIVTYNCWNGIIMCKLTRRISNKIGNLYRSFVLSSMQLLQLRMGLMYMQAGHNILRYTLSLCIWRPRTKLRCLRNYDTEHNQTKNSITRIMITSSKGIFFCVTGPLWWESNGHRCIPLTKVSDAEIWNFRFLSYTDVYRIISVMGPSHYLNWYWNVVKWTLGDKLYWKFLIKIHTFAFKKMQFKRSSAKMAAILSQLQCVNLKFGWCSHYGTSQS